MTKCFDLPFPGHDVAFSLICQFRKSETINNNNNSKVWNCYGFEPLVKSVLANSERTAVCILCNNAECDTQWSCTVTWSARSWLGFCSAPRTATWPTATSLSSRTSQFRSLALCGRGLIMRLIRKIFLDDSELFTPWNRYVILLLILYYNYFQLLFIVQSTFMFAECVLLCTFQFPFQSHVWVLGFNLLRHSRWYTGPQLF